MLYELEAEHESGLLILFLFINLVSSFWQALGKKSPVMAPTWFVKHVQAFSYYHPWCPGGKLWTGNSLPLLLLL